ADDVCSQLLHLGEVRLDGEPLGFPIVFEEATRLVVVVVEAPRRELLAGRLQSEGLLVLGNPDPGHFRTLGLALKAGAVKDTSKQKELAHDSLSPHHRLAVNLIPTLVAARLGGGHFSFLTPGALISVQEQFALVSQRDAALRTGRILQLEIPDLPA